MNLLKIDSRSITNIRCLLSQYRTINFNSKSNFNCKSFELFKYITQIKSRKLHSFSEFNVSKISQNFYEPRFSIDENLNLPRNNKYPALRKFKVLRSLSIFCQLDQSACEKLSQDERFHSLICDINKWSVLLRVNERCDILRFFDIFLTNRVIKDAQMKNEIDKVVMSLIITIKTYAFEGFKLDYLVTCILSLVNHTSELSTANSFLQLCSKRIERIYQMDNFASANILTLIRMLSIPSSLLSDEIADSIIPILFARVIDVEKMPKDFSIQNVKHLLKYFGTNGIFHDKLFHRCVSRYRGSLAYDHFTLKDNLEILEMFVNLCYRTDYAPYFALRILTKTLNRDELERYFLKHLSFDSLKSRGAGADEFLVAGNVLSRLSLYMAILGWYSDNIRSELNLFNQQGHLPEKNADVNLATFLHSYDGVRYVSLNSEEYSAIKYYPWQLYLRFARGEKLNSKHDDELKNILHQYKACKEKYVNDFIAEVETLQLSDISLEPFAIRDGLLFDAVITFPDDAEFREAGIYMPLVPDGLVDKPLNIYLDSLKFSDKLPVSSVNIFKFGGWRLKKTPLERENYLIRFLHSVLIATTDNKESSEQRFSSQEDEVEESLSPEEIKAMNSKLLDYLSKGMFNIQVPGFSATLPISEYQAIQSKIKEKTAPNRTIQDKIDEMNLSTKSTKNSSSRTHTHRDKE